MPLLIAILACAAYAALWLLHPQRFNPSDPWAYSQNAWEISQGFADFLAHASNHPFTHRLAVTVPVAAIYKLFGVSLWLTNLWPLLCVFFILAALCAALPSNRERALAVFLCVTCVGLFRQSVALTADVVATGMLFPAAVVLFHRAAAKRGGARSLAPLAFALLVFLAFMAKETAYWILPVWAYAFAVDARGERATLRRFHIPALAALAALAVAYMVFCERVWGHPLARLLSVQELTGHHLWSWQNATAYEWFKRLVLAPPKIFLLEFGSATLLAAVAVWLSPRRNLFWTVYSASMILLFWFGSTAFSRYEPLPAVSRMVLPAVPGLIVLAASLTPRLFGPAASRALRGLVAIAFLPFVVYAATWDFSPDPRESAVARVRAETATKSRVLLLTADVRSPGHLAFYFGYRYPRNLVVASAETYAATQDTAAFDAAYLFSSRALSKTLRGQGDTDFEPAIAAMRLPVVFADGDFRLFAVPDPAGTREALRAFIAR